jgi:3-oxoadipate enol-lactonase
MLGHVFLSISSLWMMVNLCVHPPDYYSMIPNDLRSKEISRSSDTGYIDVEGGRLYYEMSGQGETIMFIHDGLVHSATWDEQFDRFAGEYRVIRYDRRGYGQSGPACAPYSDLEDLHRLFEQLQVSEAHLIGCSAGGRLAIDFALAYPEKVKSLILVGGVVSGLSFTDHFYTRGGLAKKEYFSDPERAIKYWVFDDPYEIAPENTAVKKKVAALLEANPQNVTATSGGIIKRPPPAVERLAEIDVPVLIVVGEKDIPDVHAHAGVINEGIKGSRRIIVSGAGHLVHLEQPEVFNREVARFFKYEKLFAVMKKEGAEKAYELFEKIKDRNKGEIPFEEMRMNQLGYEYLQKGDVEAALLIFKMNMEAYPNSFNVYDSYGEAQLVKGDTAAAVGNYRKSLKLNPDNTNAVNILKNIEGARSFQ